MCFFFKQKTAYVMRISGLSADVCSSDRPRGEDICYATSNRQAATKVIAASCDAVIVLGAPNSSNSLRLVEVAERQGRPAILLQRAADLDLGWLTGVRTLGVTAGASAPALLVRELVERPGEHYQVVEREVETIRDQVRSGERRVGEERVRECISRGA